MNLAMNRERGTIQNTASLNNISVVTPLSAQSPAVGPGQLNKQEHDPVLKSIDGITIHDRLGSSVPLAGKIRRSNGDWVSLESILDSGLPVIFNPIYFSCPMLCNMVVENLLKSMAECDLVLGQDYEIVTMSIDPRDKPLDARNRKRALLEVFLEEAQLTGVSTETAEKGWHFLTALLFLLMNTLLCMVCKLLQIRGHRFDFGMHLH